MATRQDELSAQTFARKRTLAAFLQPEGRVSDDAAPRPVRAMMPSIVVGVMCTAGALIWGALAPAAPPHWDDAGAQVIVDKDSTSRYIVLNKKTKNGKVRELHPVLNYASARLLLDKDKGSKVTEVAGDAIDKATIARGATVGIPYAPDRLPHKGDAGTAKEWAVCEKPGSTSANAAAKLGVFVFGPHDKKKIEGDGRLGKRDAMYVRTLDGTRYVVTGDGTALKLVARAGSPQDINTLASVVMKAPGEPQLVSNDWLRTLHQGHPLGFLQGITQGTRAPGFDASSLPQKAQQFGAVIETNPAGVPNYYVVSNKLQRISPLLAKVIMAQRSQAAAIPATVAQAAGAGADSTTSTETNGWPEKALTPMNQGSGGSRHTGNVSCSVYTGKMGANGHTKLGAWAGKSYPANLVQNSASGYVSSGSGLLYQEVTGNGQGGGRTYLLTDSGLRYALSGTGGADQQQAGGKEQQSAQTRLGYEGVKPVKVPEGWSQLLPKGPTLDTKAASQEQGM